MQAQTSNEKVKNYEGTINWLTGDGYAALLKIAEQVKEDDVPLIFENGPTRFEPTEELQRVMHSHGMLIKKLDWQEYADEAERLMKSQKFVGDLDLDDVGRLLTYMVKKEVSNPGHLYGLAYKGKVEAVLNRMREIVGPVDEES